MNSYSLLHALRLTVLVVLLGAFVTPALAVRNYGGFYTAERLAALRANCDKYDWARSLRKAAVARAQFWVNKSDDDLWRMIPGQKLPRCIDVSYYKRRRTGCPQCGMAIYQKYGNYPYSPDLWGKPWKLTCANCKVVFPTNDFGKYYVSGIDETGVFNPDKADKSLLFNTEHPGPNDPLHKHGVDDGYGWFDKDGNRYLFIAYYVWQYWNQVLGGINALANAYVYTGEQKYAHKALIMLDRLADVYPDYDWSAYAKLGYYHSDGGGGKGKIQGSIWESSTVTNFATAIDMVLSGTRDDPALYQFLADKGKQFKLPTAKGTRELLVQNLDDRLLREGAKAVYDGRVSANEGGNQTTLATCAIALDTNPDTEKWLDYLFEAKGEHIPTVVVGGLDRDGVGAEAAPGYALGWGVAMGRCADLLADYGKYTKHSIYRDFPQFKATFTAGWNLVMLGFATPNIGDSGACGTLGIVASDPNFIARGYKYLRDRRIALAAYLANHNSGAGLGRDIFSPAPDSLEKEITAIGQKAKNQGNPWASGHNRAGYGLASLAFGWGKPGTALWMYYGRNGGHGHQDRFNFDILYRGLCMLPDHGYPEYTSSWPHRGYVTNNTLSHNTVVVNQVRQSFNWVGQPELFCQFEDFGAMRVESREMYAGLTKYERTLAFVKLGEGHAYVFDVFRVQGGKDHLYSLHGPPGEVTVQGLNLVKQEKGSYMGPEVEYRKETGYGAKCGYSWVTHVERDEHPAAAFVVDWKAQAGYRGVTDKDDIHLRYHCLTQLDDVALGDMEPPQNKAGNPRWLRYVLAHRAGTNVNSTFTGVIEPYTGQPAIAKVERLRVAPVSLDTTNQPVRDGVALKVTLTDGAVDYLVSGEDGTTIFKAEGGPEFAGEMGWLRVREGHVDRAALSRGMRLTLGGFALGTKVPGYTGKIVKMKKDMAGEGYVWVDTPLPLDAALVGQQMIIANDRVRNACYTIQSVVKDGDLYKVNLGEVCFIRGYRDRNDYGKGFVYDFVEGAPFIVPLAVRAYRQAPNTYRVQATAPVEVTWPK
jgi:hypothetical protein